MPSGSAGDAAYIVIKVQTGDFDTGSEIAALSRGRGDVGAVASFVGLVRDRAAAEDAAGSVVAMELEHYPGMTEKALQEIAEEACARWPLSAAEVEELEAAAAAYRATGNDLGAMTSASFPLPKTGAVLADLRRDLIAGIGFRLISGLPVDRMDRWTAAAIFSTARAKS